MRQAVRRVARGMFFVIKLAFDLMTAMTVLFLVVLIWGTP